MTQEIINIGAQANDGEGDPLRTAFAKINNNFTQLFGTGWATTESVTTDDTKQSIFSVDATLFTQAQFQINSVDPDSNNSQNVTLTAAISSDMTSVKFTAFNTLINGDPVVSDYDMDIVDGLVNVYVSPLIDAQLKHFIGYQIMFNDNVVGMMMTTESDDTLTTELGYTITTEQPA